MSYFGNILQLKFKAWRSIIFT